ncbi:hypothetical protein F0Q45_18615 [Mycobacterium simiae]|uniref:Phage head morphogenesis domain-containing protein n=1 Tax=Mycobacterium simiae TaxID=1784 RepID=A0A5B1BK77_MYCSI|nr:hypothetical protein [Mycobacterium simiae]KAA1248796.1 hypothetical protein F0Q45_18615 [Mycobacterium simiae]
MTVVDDYQARTAGLADSAAVRVAGVYAALRAGHLTADEAQQLIAATVNAANAASFSLADAYIAMQIEQATGTPTPTTGVLPLDELERLLLAVHTIFEGLVQQAEAHIAASQRHEGTADPHTAEMRLERLARSEPLETGQKASVAAMTAQPMVEGWTRQLDADPCQLCRWWWRDGRIWPKDHPFPSHKGCNCQPKIVLAESIQSTQFTRQLERNKP